MTRDPRDYQPPGLHAQRRLLIVEDDAPHRRSLMLSFEKRGYEVKAASCAPEASILLDEWRPDYVIIDVCLPGPAGLTLIPRVKFVSPDARVVIVSGYASIAAAVQSIKLGATQYLMKPVDAQTIEAAFGNQRADVTVRPGDSLPSVERVAWEYMQRVLIECNGNISATARALRMHRKTLQRKLGRHPVSH